MKNYASFTSQGTFSLKFNNWHYEIYYETDIMN